MTNVLVATAQDTAIGPFADGVDMRFERVESGQAVLDRLEAGLVPDVMLLDYDLPQMSGIRGIRAARTRLRECPLGVLLIGAPLDLARRLLVAGADAIVPISVAQDRAALRATVLLLQAGQTFVAFPPDLRPKPGRGPEDLSERELQVLEGLCDGLQNKEIAHAFGIQEVTAKMHVRAIIRKLGVRNRTQAAVLARDLGIV